MSLRERREHRVFMKLLQMIPGLEERLVQSSEPEVVLIADLVSPPTCPWPPTQIISDQERCIECPI